MSARAIDTHETGSKFGWWDPSRPLVRGVDQGYVPSRWTCVEVDVLCVDGPLQPLSWHLTVVVNLLRFESIFFSSPSGMFCRHLLHETPQVEGIGIKTNQFGSSLPIGLSESGDPLLMVSVEDDGGMREK